MIGSVRVVFRGFGTLLNVITILVGTGLGVLLGHRLPSRTRDVVTDAIGLVTLLIAAFAAYAVRDPALVGLVGPNAPMLIVLASLVVGGVIGSLLRLELRLEGLGHRLQARLAGRAASPERRLFVEGFVAASLLFCVGPLTVLGSISDGLGRGSEQLALKATLDGITSVAFAASFGWGVAAAALTVLVVQGGLTVVGALVGTFLSTGQVSALTATGGLLLVGVALRLLRVRQLPVGDLLPALALAPLFTALVSSWG
ncbi:DUF554 domain-containing protein [Actinopolymorpha cephalotaxi]|uniref:DUF554 domain-containing protein n=1 Tax=Actinopolymorpha cephalotaxi TaxID=504797 RepID=A0ABX2RZJ0_9ACTN|nr:DUF554 domain-containing protein [Actinopolymorpha cephalotaxi]NYH82775.1 hypothetical protein [Actinopolymorpha cephalotaxi]